MAPRARRQSRVGSAPRPWYIRNISVTINNSAFDRATQPIFGILTREQVLQIADYHADQELQERITQLADKANEGELTDEERAEYEGYVHANRFVAILQAQARRRISAKP
jgi:hypothetical protein